jgi:hypothetical protein
MSEQIEKPILVKRKDVADDISAIIATSGLPAFAMIDIFENAVDILKQMNIEQEKQQITEYQRKVAAQNANNKKEGKTPVQA